MFYQLFGDLTSRHILVATAIFGAFAILAWLLHVFLAKTIHKLTQKITVKLDEAVIQAVSKPITAISILAGVYFSVLFLPVEPLARALFIKVTTTLFSSLGIYTEIALLNGAATWYLHEILPTRKSAGLNSTMLQVFRIGVVAVAILVAVIIALEIWGVSVGAIAWVVDHGWRIALIIVLSMMGTLAVGEFVPRLVVSSLICRSGESKEEIDKRGVTLSRVLVGVGQVAIILIAIFMLLAELEINIAPILAGVGVAGIAIGFGAQSLVKDLVAGLFIILENQYRVGDVIKIADVSGLVEDINLRRTVLRDLDGIVHIIPNGEIRVASNFTREWSRVNLNVSVAYKEDLDRVMSVIDRVGKELAEDPQWAPLILTPPKALRVDNLGDSGIEIKILGETKPIRQWDVMGELRRRLKKTFDEEGIEIPWPHTKVYFGNSPPSKEGPN